MLLKGLTLQGFKSFADKIELQFGPGVSVIVGPNGSGKSNIADGIRWVLGEQSAKSLRGAKMEDIIFAGSAKRRSVGMAEITLTLNNTSGYFLSQYSEIAITRRLYRSGESEFLINKRPCRLKDVHELLMDTGLGKEAFSIIGQGKVEEILNSKSEERRFIVEEVAGIVKYKNKKKEAMKRLEETEQHLQRIRDLISELQEQLNPLEQQAEKAKIYKKLKLELDDLEIAVITKDIIGLAALAEELHQQMSLLTKEKTELETKIAHNNAELERFKLQLAQESAILSKAQQELYQLNNSIEKLEANIKYNRQLLTEYDQQENILLAEIKSLTDKLKDIKVQMAQLKEKLIHLKLAQQEKKAQVTLIEENLAAKKHNLNELLLNQGEINNSLFEIATSRAQQKNMMTYCDSELDKISKAKEKKVKELAGLQQQLSNLAQQEQTIIVNLNLELTETNQLHQEKQQLIGVREEHFSIQTELQKKYQDLELKMEQNTSKLAVLKEMESSFEGYQLGVKTVLKRCQEKPNSLPGVVGVIGDLIKVEDKYLTAIEIALGGAIQNIVTKTQQAAKIAIKYLKERQGGRCTFLPIESVTAPAKIKLGEVANWPNVCGIASDYINFDSQLSSIIGYLLHRTILVADIDAAVMTAKHFGYKVKIVTLAGEVISPGGALTGGSHKFKQVGLLSRNIEIKKLEEWVTQTKRIQAELIAELKGLNSKVTNQDFQLKELDEKIVQKQLLQVEMENDKKQITVEILRSKGMQQALIQEISQLEQEKQHSLNEKGATEEKYRASGLQEEKDKQKAAELQTKITSLEKEMEQANNKLTDEKVNLANIAQETGYLQSQVVKLEEFYAGEKANIFKKEEDYHSLMQKVDSYQGAIHSGEEELTRKISEKKDGESELISLHKAQSRLENEIKKLEESINLFTKEITEEREKIHQLELKLARVESENKGYLARLTENFLITLAEAKQKVTLNMDKKEAYGRIKELKKQLGTMGEVNLGAIEEHARVLERYQFLQAQYHDLEKARLSLNKVIKEMEAIMEERFSLAFSQLNEQFAMVFQELFGGGKAELILTNEENMLETGIDIIAQPPGKKQQHLSLLSGGERALTAIALLFSILKIKPSPFCVLDEIEASLDEANVYRFAGFLQDFSQKTQFVVISHRKGTMEIANVLYGVTMEESGVSKLVSVKLAETAS